MKCPKCGSTELSKNGSKKGIQRFICRDCGRYFSANSSKETNFKSSKSKTKKMGGISVEQFRKKYDVVFILSQVPEKFEEGVLYEKSDIIIMAKLTAGFMGITTVLESEAWKKYTGKAGSKSWYGRAELIEKLINEGIMR